MMRHDRVGFPQALQDGSNFLNPLAFVAEVQQFAPTMFLGQT